MLTIQASKEKEGCSSVIVANSTYICECFLEEFKGCLTTAKIGMIMNCATRSIQGNSSGLLYVL
jgi:hypothetical protein